MKKIILFSCILSLSLVFAEAQEREYYLNLDDCRQMAVDSNLLMTNARLMEEKTRMDKNAIRANFFPKISGFGAYLIRNKDIDLTIPKTGLPTYKLVNGQMVPDLVYGPDGIPVFGPDGNPLFNQYAVIPETTLSFSLNNNYAVGLMAQQPIFMGGKIITGFKMAQLGMSMASLNTQMNRTELIVKIDESYWLLVKANQLRETAGSFRLTVDSLYAMVEGAVETGMAMRSDLLKVKVQQDKAKLLQAKARNGASLAKMNLCNQLGLPLLSRLTVDESGFDTLEDADTLSGNVYNRYDYQLINKQLELKKKNVALVRSDFLPQLGVAATYGYANAIKFKDDAMLDGASFSVLATLKVPIFSWGEGYYKVKSAKIERDMQANELARLEEMMLLEQTQLQQQLMEAQLRVNLANSSKETAAENLKISKDRYETGMETLTAVLEAQTQWHQTQSEYIEAIADYRLTYTKYMKACGRL